MASKIAMDAKIAAHFGTCDASEAQRLFGTVRGIMAARKLLGRGAPKAKTTVARAAKVTTVAPAQAASGEQAAQ